MRLGPYEIVAPLGAGGMGEVYRARDTRLDRVVALKVLSSELARNPEFRSRFDREARAISKLSHPHICTLYDVGSDNGAPYLVMELIHGETLADRLSGTARSNRVATNGLPVNEALTIAIQLADALAAAHATGIVHRDFKPATIMRTETGAKLLDFGLAKPAVPAVATGDATTGPHPITAGFTILGTFQ